MKLYHQEIQTLMNNQQRIQFLLDNEIKDLYNRLQRKLQLRQLNIITNCIITRMLELKKFYLFENFNQKLNKQLR